VKIRTYVGSDGHAVWFSDDLGATWVRPNSLSGLYLEVAVRGFASHASDARTLLAATSHGLMRWDEYDSLWSATTFPSKDVWAVAQSEKNPDVIYAGTCPASVYRSSDRGKSWQPCKLPNLAQFSDINRGPTRVTQILFDPLDDKTIWVTVEIGGIYRSTDDGETWTLLTQGLVSADIHGVLATPDAQGRRLMMATTNRGLHYSRDGGDTWTFVQLDSPWQYTRFVQLRLDGFKRIFLANGDWPPGSTGRLLVSDDAGQTWNEHGLPAETNSSVWCFGMNAADPQLVYVLTSLGQLFISQDGGDTFRKIKREFGSVRSVHWRPVPDDVPVIEQKRSSISLSPAKAA
jgi:photosystem II stability/assembly factor-like uncharacterized protein